MFSYRARPKKFLPEVPELSPEEIEAQKKKEVITFAVKLIQTHERGRQARNYYLEFFTINAAKKAIAAGEKQPPTPEPSTLNNAAVGIQKVWRGHQAREYMKRREKERRLLIGTKINLKIQNVSD